LIVWSTYQSLQADKALRAYTTPVIDFCTASVYPNPSSGRTVQAVAARAKRSSIVPQKGLAFSLTIWLHRREQNYQAMRDFPEKGMFGPDRVRWTEFA
jgi:hypothetical protein